MKSPFRRTWVRLVSMGVLWVAWGAVVAAYAMGERQGGDMPKPQAAAIGVTALGLAAWLVIEICLGLWRLMGRWVLVMLLPVAGIVGWNAAGQPRLPVTPLAPEAGPRGAIAFITAVPTAVATYAPPPASTPTPLAALACSAQPSTVQTAADGQIITKAAAAKVGLLLPRSCAGFSLFYQQGLEQTAAQDYLDGLMLGYPRYVADSGFTPRDRIGVFVLADAAQRAAACKAVLGNCAIAPNDTAPGIQTQGHIWIDDSKNKTQTFRRSAGAHELTHAFVLAISRDRNVPDWLNEGFAVYNEIEVPAERQPLAAERETALQRKTALDALSGKGPLPLFAWSEIATNKQWQANYTDPQKETLQYAQAYYAVKWLMDNKGGPPAMWKLISALAIVPFPEALSRVDGITQTDLEAQLKTAWTAELQRPADVARISVKISPTGVQGNTEVFVFRKRPDGSQERAYTRPLQPGEYTFELSQAGGLTSADPAQTITTDDKSNLSCDCFEAMIANANYRGANGAAPRGNEVAEYELAYGKWGPLARTFFPAGGATGEPLPGKMSDPFPDGNQITVRFAAPS